MVNLETRNGIEMMQRAADGFFDFILTDAPYDLRPDLVQEFLKQARRICKGNIIVFNAPKNQFFKPDEMLFWVKQPSTKNNTRHVSNYLELILVERPKGSTFNGYPALHWSAYTGVYTDLVEGEMWHPYKKPLSLLQRLMGIYTKKGDIGLDPFAGSFQTGVAAKNLGRDLVGYELQEKYVKEFYERNSVKLP